MPIPSQINRDNNATANPFQNQGQTVSAYTAIEIATLQARLNRQLGPEYISTRPGAGGGKLHYLSADKAINLANSVFGFSGWSSSIQQVQVDFVDENASTGRISLGLSVICRVTLKDGTFHEDIGYGQSENCKGKAAAFEKAKKEAATDAMKRALRNFGNVLGNCLYDKDYLSKVTKVKAMPSKFDADNLHRHPEFVPTHQGSSETPAVDPKPITRMRSDRSAVTAESSMYGEDDFEDDALFEGVPADAVLLEDSIMMDAETLDSTGLARPQPNQTPARPLQRVQSMPNVPKQNGQPQRTTMQPPNPPSRAIDPTKTVHQGPRSNGNHANGTSAQALPAAKANGSAAEVAKPSEQELGNAVPGGRFMAMGALRKGTYEDFNPSKETPSIRRTTGVNSGKSEPITRAALNGETPSKPQPAPGPPAQNHMAAPNPRTNFVNPSADMHRRIGMPVAPQSPMSNRGSYKPPSAVKRPAPTEAPPTRPPLADTTNVLPENGVPDAKKPKIDATTAPAQGADGTKT